MPPRLFLIDGYALIYRAFFAMISRPLRTSKGENTSAAWGVANFLLRLREKYRPDYVAWINDAGTSFREARYPDYKSTREKLDEELQADFDRALERIRSLLAAFRVPLVTVPGYEADDVIGTLATAAAGRGLQAVIVSGDKDFYQLIGPGVALLNPGRGGPAAVEETWVDESNAGERLGVPPSQVVDFLALVGDSSDNVPGVKGIGEKGAQKLLLEYGDLDAILAHASEVSAKRTREALLGQADNARLSRELVTLKRDVPIELDVSLLTLQEPDQEAAVRILTELEFYSLARKLAGQGSAPAAAPAGAGPPPSPAPTTDEADAAEPAASGATPTAADWLALDSAPQLAVSVVDDPAEIPALVERLRRAPLVALDVETSSIEPRDAEIVGLSLAASPGEVWYLPLAHRPVGGELAAPTSVRNLPPLSDPAMAPLRALLTDRSVPKAAHDIKYDWQVLRGVGIELDGVAYDTMLASFVLDPGRRSHAIDNLCLEHLGRAMKTYADVAGRGKTEVPFAEVAILAAAEYCGTDAGTVLSLHEFFAPSLREMAAEPLLREIEMPLVEVLVDMEW
ncbi:MAG TPA: 5'-3' exonuclease H3TH domain-containing protein, partial [Gemmatimonadales bacterium]|nr:5'-3' exonuclease H3TH domain-containing protein [Gemmatimonadales bacterium]